MIKILLYVAGTDIHYYNKALTRLRDMYEGVPVVTVGWLGENSYKIQNNGG